LTLPAESQFAVNATVGNGSIGTDFPVASAAPDARVVKGTVGSNPDTTLTATTGNGRIDIRRGN
jgi:hypothetical protein